MQRRMSQRFYWCTSDWHHPSIRLRLWLQLGIVAQQVEKGATAAVFGLGTIGLACVDALATVGASRIIGVDTDPGKHARAKEWGATEVINPKDYDKPIQVRTLICKMS